ncbi:hypothetical protein [Halorubrum kocurii]|uniref:hypothetical protein n=1 Tax=Halorubrum kocurii TaxID=478441 RepID=UPI001F4C8402|nr:hypothetical protein [Halorubrum kocurii]
MSSDVEPSDWARLDPWFEAYLGSGSGAGTQRSDRERVLREPGQEWEAIDSVAQAGLNSKSTLFCSPPLQVTNQDQLTEWWTELDTWWDTFSKAGHQNAIEIADLLEQSNESWATSAAPFETDPLAADITGTRTLRGPVRPSGELDWSQWLAQLLEPSAALVRELFGVPSDEPPNKVLREARLPKEDGGRRRADILVRHPDYGVSIEVKLGDENYRKTPETARLIERHYDDVRWDHILLLPKRQRGRLNAVVSPSIDEHADGTREIVWDESGPITVLYWQDVATAVRAVLQRGDVVDDHWAANAYLFCATVEQHISGFQSQPVIDRMVDPSGVVETVRPIVVSDALDEQLTYLRSRLGL